MNNSCRHCFWPSVSDIAVWSVVKTRTVGWNGSMCSQLKRRGSAVLMCFIVLLYTSSLSYILITSKYSILFMICFCILMPHLSSYDIVTAQSLWESLSMAVCILGLRSTCLRHDIVRSVFYIPSISLSTATFCTFCYLSVGFCLRFLVLLAHIEKTLQSGQSQECSSDWAVHLQILNSQWNVLAGPNYLDETTCGF